MRLRKIRPDEEAFSDIWMTLAFLLVWYGTLIFGAIRAEIEWAEAFPFLIVGILPLYSVYSRIYSALFFRKKRSEAIALGRCCKGTIQSISIEKMPYDLHRGHIHYRTMYYLIISKEENDSGLYTKIKSSAYRFPVPYYLESPEVTLYSDSSGWKWYVEDLKCGRRKKGQCILETEGCKEGSYAGQQLFRTVVIIGLLYTFMSMIFK